MKTEIDITTWDRREQFLYFLDFGDPFCGITTRIDVTRLYDETKANGGSFYLSILYAILDTANQYAPMRLRIEDNKLYQYDVVDIAPTVGYNNSTFGFAYLQYSSSRETFISESREIIRMLKDAKELSPQSRHSDRAVIFSSAIPWFDFTHVKNPYPLIPNDSIPRITTGPPFLFENRRLMTIQIDVHHSLMDGFHISEFIRILTEKTNGVSSFNCFK